MVDLDYPRDVAFIAAVFGVAAIVWSAWGQEHPPPRRVWRFVLGVLSLAGVALAVIGVALVARLWSTPTAVEPGTPGFFFYVIVFWVEFAGTALLVYLAIHAGMSDFAAPIVLAAVGISLFTLAPAFQQPMLFLPAALLTIAGIASAFIPSDDVARSFWCGVLASPVFVVIGAWAAVVAARIPAA